MDESIKKELKTGTTTVGVVASNAIVLGAERKATMGYLVASRHAKKILELDRHIAMSIAGIVGDAQMLERYIKAEVKLYYLKEGKKIPTQAAANLIANILYSRRFYPYIVQLVVGGYDSEPHLFSLAPDGSVMEEKEFFSTGSGSPIAFGVLEDKFRKDMPLEEAKLLVAKSINSAVKRDIASGGSGIDMVVIDSGGIKWIGEEEINKMIK